MKRVEYFPKKMAEREAALVASPASGQDWDRPTAPGQFRSFAEEDSSKNPPAKPEAFRLLAPQRGLIAIDPKTSAPEVDLHPETFYT